MKRLDSIKLKPVKETNEKVSALGFKPLTDAVTAKEFLRRPEVSYQDVVNFIGPAAEELDDKIIELIETEIKYEDSFHSSPVLFYHPKATYTIPKQSDYL